MPHADRLREVLESLPACAVCTLDAKGNVTAANAAAARLSGRDPAALPGLHFSQMWSPSAVRDERPLAAAAATGLYEAVGWCGGRGDGTPIHLRQLILAGPVAAGAPASYLMVAHAIAPNTLPAGAAALARAAKLDALSRLGGNVAHEFNNITQVIKTAIDILELRLGAADAEVTRYLDLIRRGADRATAATQRLLAFAGGQMVAPAPTPVNPLVQGLAAALRGSYGPRIAIETTLHPEAGQAQVDPAGLQTTLRALTDNACEAMRGTGRIHIETGIAGPDAPERARNQVFIAVRDEGVGMSEEVRAHAGEPYFTTKSGGHGAGLGLAQAYGFVRQSGGCLEIDSAPGAGTTARVYLPRVVPAPRPEPADTPAAGASLAGVRVLVVEDEMLVAIMVEDLLAQLGCEVVGLASSVRDALAYARRDGIDLALLDVNLRSESAYPVAALLEERGVPFVFMSGGGHVAEGWHDRPVIQKPFQLEHMRREIERVLANRRAPT